MTDLDVSKPVSQNNKRMAIRAELKKLQTKPGEYFFKLTNVQDRGGDRQTTIIHCG